MHQFAFGAFLIAAIVLFSGVGTPTHAGDAIPNAPSDVQALGRVLSWTDNSDNEDGFRIVIRIGSNLGDSDFESRFEVSLDTTTFVLPPKISLGCPDRTAVSFQVTAFNEIGESDTAEISIQALCPAPTVEATVEPTVGPTVLPETGGSAQRGAQARRLPGARL